MRDFDTILVAGLDRPRPGIQVHVHDGGPIGSTIHEAVAS
jgi:hypothetical protein